KTEIADPSDTESDPIENYTHRAMPRLFDSDSDESDDGGYAQRRLLRRRDAVLYDSDESEELEVVGEPRSEHALRLQGQLTHEQQLVAFQLSMLSQLVRRNFQCASAVDVWLQ